MRIMTTNSESKSETTGAVKAKRDEYRTLPLSELAPDPDQPRKHFDDAKLAELGENLKTAGVLVPLLVRPHPKPAEAAKTLFLLVDGERRWRAAQLAGLKEMPCLVRAMTDLEALETQGLTQLQREDLTAMEEARWMARLVEGGAHTRESLAAKLGIQRTTVYNRLRLARATGPLAAAVESGKLDATKAVAILGIPDSKGQAECLKVALEEDWDGNVMSFRNLERLIESSYRRPLKDAPWDLKTEQLGGQCSCASCPKRSGNMTEEYPQLKASPNVCTELACWEKKKQAHISQVLEKARSAGQQGLTPK
jgi:ParB/RepB/Spo0J family partition protein